MRKVSSVRLLLAAFVLFLLGASPSEPADVIVVGDMRLAPVDHIVSGIREALDVKLKVFAPLDVKDRLSSIASREDAKVVVALGRDALEEALRLPQSVAVVYDLVVSPPAVKRLNMTGHYMATPVREYVSIIRRYLPLIRHIAVVGSSELMRTLETSGDPMVSPHRVKNAFELVETVKQLDSADAILLLPDVSFLTASALEEVYLYSFRRGIPVLGISEKNVRQGALFALVFDPVYVGANLENEVSLAIHGEDIGRIPPSPSQKFELYINLNTAEKMNIAMPGELVRKAKKVFH
ncbi:MAG: ABC transporter substrate binding protein [Nitrospiraceae bacterium]|nr:ABC transporter substrate binding protein [Nitrospiraceae bacterium]